jgi:hypothetical protein
MNNYHLGLSKSKFGLTEAQWAHLYSLIFELKKEYTSLWCHFRKRKDDEEFDELCSELSVNVVHHGKNGEAYSTVGKDIVLISRKVVGAVDDIGNMNSDPWFMVNFAFQQGVPSVVLWPDGSYSSR